MQIEDTGFTGQLFDFTNMGSLQELHASGCAFDGALPDSIGNAVSLKVLDLEHSSLSGPLNPLLSNCAAMTHLKLAHNDFSGPLPATCAEAAVVQGLGTVAVDAAACGNVVMGTPTAAADCAAVMTAAANTVGACTYRGLLGQVLDLQELDISYNSFSGSLGGLLDTLPGAVAYPTLNTFNVEENQVRFAIDVQRVATNLWVSFGKQIDGDIPASIGRYPIWHSKSWILH